MESQIWRSLFDFFYDLPLTNKYGLGSAGLSWAGFGWAWLPSAGLLGGWVFVIKYTVKVKFFSIYWGQE